MLIINILPYVPFRFGLSVLKLLRNFKIIDFYGYLERKVRVRFKIFGTVESQVKMPVTN